MRRLAGRLVPKLPRHLFVLLTLSRQQQHHGTLRNAHCHTPPAGVPFQLESLVFGRHDGRSYTHVPLTNTGYLLERLTQPRDVPRLPWSQVLILATLSVTITRVSPGRSWLWKFVL